MSDALPASAARLPGLRVSPLLLAALLAIVFFSAFAWLSVLRVDLYVAGADDLDIQGQVIWNSAHGRPFASTILTQNDSHLAEHLAFSLVPLALVYAFAPDSRILVALQAAALAGSAFPVYWYGLRLLGPWRALMVQCAYLAAPLVAAIALDDFHPVVLAVAPLALAAYFLLTERPRLGVPLLALAVLAEEEAALPVLGLGLLLALRGGRKLGISLSLGAALYLLVATQFVMPAFQQPGAGQNRSLAHFSALQADPGVLAQRFRPARLSDAVQWLVVPNGGVILAGPAALIPVAPTFVTLFVQDEELGTRYRGHWAATMLPFLGFGAAEGLRRLSRIPLGHVAGALLLVVGAAIGYVSQSALPGGGRFEVDAPRNATRRLELARALAAVPEDASIVASQSLAAYLNNRPRIYLFPPALHYVPDLVARADAADVAVLDLYDETTLGTLGNRRYSPLLRDPPPVLISPAYKLLLAYRTFPAPSRVAEGAIFGDTIELKGFDVSWRGSTLSLILHWQAARGTVFSYGRTVQLLDGQGSIVAEENRMGLLNVVPTEDWHSGQQVVDPLEFDTLDASAVARVVRFRVSWGPSKPAKAQPALELPDGSAAWESDPIR